MDNDEEDDGTLKDIPSGPGDDRGTSVVTPASASSFTDSMASFTPATPGSSTLPNPSLDLAATLREFMQKVEDSTQKSLALIRKELMESRPAAPLADTLPKCTPQNLWRFAGHMVVSDGILHIG